MMNEMIGRGGMTGESIMDGMGKVTNSCRVTCTARVAHAAKKVSAAAIFTLVLTLGLCGQTIAQNDTMAPYNQIESGVYKWADLSFEGGMDVESVEMLSGSALGMDELDVYGVIAGPGVTAMSESVNADRELMLIVKEGRLNISAGDVHDRVGPGSVALIMPGDRYSIVAEEGAPASFYILSYMSRTPVGSEAGDDGGGSMIVDFEELEFRPHDRGGQWQYMNRQTAVLGRMDIHVTSLNAGIKSHEPHTHRAPEIVLMIENDSEMEIGDGFYQGSAGDLYFLGSNVPHALENIGDEATRYFAIQWSD